MFALRVLSCLSGVLQGGEREVESWGEGGDVAGGAMRPRKSEGQAAERLSRARSNKKSSFQSVREKMMMLRGRLDKPV